MRTLWQNWRSERNEDGYRFSEGFQLIIDPGAASRVIFHHSISSDHDDSGYANNGIKTRHQSPLRPAKYSMIISTHLSLPVIV